MAKIEKVKPENLAHSDRSPVIPVVIEEEKAQETKEPGKVKKKARTKELQKPETEKNAPKELTFPVTTRINAYGFLNFRKGLLDALGWTKGMKLTVEKNSDGSVTLCKA